MSYFDNFPQIAAATKGIPGNRMNQPLAPHPVTGDVGIELEIESLNAALPWDPAVINAGNLSCPVTKAVWQPKEDHSLRGGVEYVTSTAVAISSVPALVRGLYRNIASVKPKLNYSNRCSTHVHLNASLWKIDKVVSFYTLWAMFEEVLIDWCGPKRKANHFCLSIFDSPHTMDGLTHFLKRGEWTLSDGDKYQALNLLRLHDLGTIEIRCGDAWPDPERLIQWTSFLHTLKRRAEMLENPAMIPALVSGDTPRGMFEELCRDANAPLIYTEVMARYATSFDSTCYRGLREAIHLCYYPWDEWMELINAEYVPNPFFVPKKSGRAGLRLREMEPVPLVAAADDWVAREAQRIQAVGARGR